MIFTACNKAAEWKLLAKGFFKAVKLFEVFSCKLRRFNVMVIFTATTVRTGELYFTVYLLKKNSWHRRKNIGEKHQQIVTARHKKI